MYFPSRGTAGSNASSSARGTSGGAFRGNQSSTGQSNTKERTKSGGVFVKFKPKVNQGKNIDGEYVDYEEVK